MLQIASGKFFGTEKCYETPHRGTFYTNYRMSDGSLIETSAGSLAASGDAATPATLSYEITEKIEWQEPAPGVMTSTGGTDLVDDYAAVVAFALNVLCTTESETARRLTAGGAAGLRRSNDPSKYLRRVFDAEVPARPGDAVFVDAFVEALIGLERESYEGAIRAIRRYVTATHRIADDTSLAYALFVMSIEALAQAAEAPVAAWSDYDESKRRKIDEALTDSSTELADRVRAAVLANEHVAMSRRFRDFAIQHLAPEFFRDEAADSILPVSRLDLVTLLKHAYDIRSSYVHRLQGVPKLLTGPFSYAETFEIDGKQTLTFEGLARLARHVIKQFVHRSPKVERETFDWHAALLNILQMQLAPQYWIGRPEGYTPLTATMWLRHFLSQISAVALRAPGATLTDLSAVLDKIETLHLDTVKARQRRPMLTLYHLFILLAGEKYEREQHVKLLTRHKDDFRGPTVEALAMHLVTGAEIPWSLDQLEALHASYIQRRWHKSALMLGSFLEAVFTLRLAEANRLTGNEMRARELVSFATEAFPGFPSVLAFEQSLASDKLNSIDWRQILLPERADSQAPDEKARMAKIACLGWGSLIWNPKDLLVEEPWFEDGPIVHVEFLRQSAGDRITLVLDESANPVPSLWAKLKTGDIAEAVASLCAREGTPKENIGLWKSGDPSPPLIPDLQGWAGSHGLDAVIWTNLGRKFEGLKAPATADQVMAHFKELTGQKLKNAEEYVRRAPRQINTAYRRLIIEALGWDCAEH